MMIIFVESQIEAGRREACLEYYTDRFQRGAFVLFSQESDIVRVMRLIEELKSELVTTVGSLYKAMANHREAAIKTALASLIVTTYVLGKRLGINFTELDEAVKDSIKECGRKNAAIEERFGDFSKLERYLKR